MNVCKRYHVSLYDRDGNEVCVIKRDSYASALNWFIDFVNLCYRDGSYGKVNMYDFSMVGYRGFICNTFDASFHL